MSALGQKRTCAAQNVMSALTPEADMCGATRYVRFVPIADIVHRYSITSSARRTVKPSEPSQLGLIVPI